MVDYFSIGLTHLLLIIAAWRLMNRADLDREDVAPGTPVHDHHHRLHAVTANGAGNGPHIGAAAPDGN